MTPRVRAVMAQRFAAQLLGDRPARSGAAVVERLLAVQAQDPRGARLSVRSRTAGLLATDVDRALTEERTLVVSWLNRGTLHLVRAEDYWWLHPLTTPQLATAIARGFRQLGVTERQVRRGVDLIAAAVDGDGPLTRAQLRDRLIAARIPTDGQALVYLLMAATLDGHIVRGPMIGTHHAFVSVASWLGRPAEVDREEALARLARRYLAGHAPASARDLARWAGITLTDARRGLSSIRDETEALDDELLVLAGTPASGGAPAPRLLGPFDDLLLGWCSREPVVGAHACIVTTNGLFRPFALVDGRAVATWSLAGGALHISPLERISPTARDALLADAADVIRFLGLPAKPVSVGEPPGA